MVLALGASVVVSPISAADRSPRSPIDLRVSYGFATNDFPEVHAFVRNKGSTVVHGELRVVPEDDCVGVADPESPDSQRSLTGAKSAPAFIVELPPRVWVHQVFVLGAYGLQGPCTVAVVFHPSGLGVGAETAISEVKVPSGFGSTIGTPYSGGSPSLVYRPFAEIVGHASSRLGLKAADPSFVVDVVVHWIIENQGDRSVTVRVSRISTSCGAPGAGRSTRFLIEAGLDVGPIVIPPGGLGAFVDTAQAASNAPACIATLQLTYRAEDEWLPLPLQSLTLRPTTHVAPVFP